MVDGMVYVQPGIVGGEGQGEARERDEKGYNRLY